MVDFTELTDKFKKFNQYDKIIETLNGNDYYKIATTTYEVLLAITTTLPMVKKSDPKNLTTSRLYRQLGNNLYSEKKYGETLQAYNLALLYAPKDSPEEAYAYSNRSALFTRIKKFQASLKDIDTCIGLNITHDDGLVGKLEKRREDCVRMMWQEDVEHNNYLGDYNDTEIGKKFYEMKKERHAELPFVRNNVDLIIREGVERVIATKDIKVGEVLSIEPAFVTNSLGENRLIFCYYCNTYEDNMIPCDTCTYALFCSKECQSKCWEEYHEFECNMIEIYKLLPQWYSTWFKFVMKSWYKSGRNLDKFAELSKKVEDYMLRGEATSKLKIDDISTYFLPPRENGVKKFGMLYNTSIYTALVTYALKEISAKIFRTPFKMLFIEHAVKQLMFHVMHSINLLIPGSKIPLEEGNEDALSVNSVEADGVFPFTSRIKHNCDANTMTVGLSDKLILVCQNPIAAGTELTLAYGGHYTEHTTKERRNTIFHLIGIICDCQPCANNWPQLSFHDLHDELKRKDLEALVPLFFWTNDHKAKFKIVCDVLGKFGNGQVNKQHLLIYSMFRQILALHQFVLRKVWPVGCASKLEREDINNMLDYLRVFVNHHGHSLR